jgi:hypothetical protein
MNQKEDQGRAHPEGDIELCLERGEAVFYLIMMSWVVGTEV